MKRVDQPSLFASPDGDDESTPLAERLRPRVLDEVAGQGHLIGEGKVLRGMIANDEVPSMIFWGPPGVGKTCHFIGMPECSVHLAEAVIYLSIAPKSNSAYIAYERAKADAMERIAEPVPLVIRNAPTKLMKELEYGKGYKLAHYAENKIADLQCLPDSLQGTEYYTPTSEGVEARIAKRLEEIKAWKAELVRRRNAN